MDPTKAKLEALVERVLTKAYSNCGACGEPIEKQPEPVLVLDHPTMPLHSDWLHAEWNGYWCHGGYTTTCRPGSPIITVEDIMDIINAKEPEDTRPRCRKVWHKQEGNRVIDIECNEHEEHSIHQIEHLLFFHKFKPRIV